MRILLSILIFSFAPLSYADLNQLIKAVKANDLGAVEELLKTDALAIQVNECDRDGRRAIFFAPSEEMMRLLFSKGAILRENLFVPSLIHRDKISMNPLHFLFSYTVPLILRNAEDESAARFQIEAAAFTLIRARLQEQFSGWILESTAFQDQKDMEGKKPAEYLRGPWREEFLARMRNEKVVNDEPEGGFAAMNTRKAELQRKLDREWAIKKQNEELIERQKRMERSCSNPSLVKPVARRPMLVPEFAKDWYREPEKKPECDDWQ